MNLEGRRIVIKGPLDIEVERYSVDSDVGNSEFIVKNRFTAISAGSQFQFTMELIPGCTSRILGATTRTSPDMPDWVRS